MHTTFPARLVGLTIALLAANWALAQEPPPNRFNFEQDGAAAVWSTTACEATLSITREPAHVRSGDGALELSWQATDGRLAILTSGPLTSDARPRSLRLSVKLPGQSPVMYGVSEADGSTYQGYLYTPGGEWHDLAVDLNELMLSEGSEDENGRLDVREITEISVADLSNLSGEAGRSLGIKEGRQSMWVDDVALSAELAPHRSSRGPDGEAIIDDFDRTPILALPIGGPALSLVAGPGGDDASALRVEYPAGGYRWVGLVRAVGYLDLTERTSVHLSVRSEQAAPLHVVLEERDGSKYIGRHRLDPTRGWYTLGMPLAKFKPDPQTTDENSRLDLDQLRVIIPVVDGNRAEVGEDGGAWELSRIWLQ
ncbi:MAG: hypothetical protein GF393_11735 [Armatimonadia bacterium]|nr:hypothetical protein [Armatimonadia bacterium]